MLIISGKPAHAYMENLTSISMKFLKFRTVTSVSHASATITRALDDEVHMLKDVDLQTTQSYNLNTDSTADSIYYESLECRKYQGDPNSAIKNLVENSESDLQEDLAIPHKYFSHERKFMFMPTPFARVGEGHSDQMKR